MKMKVKFHNTPNCDRTHCFINYGEQEFVGFASCHPDDLDMANPLTGQDIAYKRAVIKMLKYEIKQYRQELKIFTNFYNSVRQSKKYNDKSYIAYRLRKEIKMLEETINTVNEIIKKKGRKSN